MIVPILALGFNFFFWLFIALLTVALLKAWLEK